MILVMDFMPTINDNIALSLNLLCFEPKYGLNMLNSFSEKLEELKKKSNKAYEKENRN